MLWYIKEKQGNDEHIFNSGYFWEDRGKYNSESFKVIGVILFIKPNDEYMAMIIL